MIRRLHWALVFVLVPLLIAQDDSGMTLYRTAAKSVFLLSVESADGRELAIGSGFCISAHQLVTNAHVANSGKVFVDLGAVKLPTKLDRLDSANDLAILTVENELQVLPLKLSQTPAAPGQTIFAIGNPEGLERSISQGVVAGMRDLRGRKLLQITSAISHGSSGGPILNIRGEVVGVAVGMLSEGQNLNFAVPIEALSALLRSKRTGQGANVPLLLGRIDSLLAEQDHADYSADPNSAWQQLQSQIVVLLHQAYDSTTDQATLLLIGDKAKWADTDLALQATERAMELRTTPIGQLQLADLLSFKSFLMDEGDAKKELLERAEKAARAALNGSRTPDNHMYFRLGDVLADEGSLPEAERMFKLGYLAQGEKTWAVANLRGQIRCASGLGRPADAVRLFQELARIGNPSGYEWDIEGDRLYGLQRYRDSAEAYVTAGVKGNGYAEWCSAAVADWMIPDDDLALSYARKCIEEGTGKDGSEKILGRPHRIIAAILQDRGVYTEALSHAKEAVAYDASDAWGYYYMARALKSLQRYQEAVTAATQAIRLSDGKYSSMHFVLGSAYFDSENFYMAKQSFEKAAELDKTDDAAAYNVGVCNARLGYFRDAADWYEEALRRNPNRSDRESLRQRIWELRR